MGLDHYLTKRTYVKNWSHQDESEKHQVIVLKNKQPRTDIKTERVSNIVEEIAEWRKFNALHNWFVQNVQDGVDNCGEYYVNRDDLKKLLEILKKVKASLDGSKKTGGGSAVNADGTLNLDDDEEEFEDTSVAEELLPTASGFFFGGTCYDRYYYENVVDTINILEAELTQNAYCDYYYSSSW
jgi:hypothetical protein